MATGELLSEFYSTGDVRMAGHGPLIAPSGDGEQSVPEIMERKTRGGRTLRYRLTILQQPERARACGSGSKSAADRRPVDPPPVVELRIFEVTGSGPQDLKDITFLYNANFFVFTSLELARPMAHGRVQTPAATSAPVLTGVPVSGMAYLDRPEEAGYFLFPDLSVRHEGRYKLGFTLYEETKEDCDFDAESTDDKAVEGPAFCYRMEIKSNPFTVFSAKKFPGLTESTTLSRTVAEQGCRVRIRRDVRMRRRDRKSGGDYDKAEGDYARRQTRTPERQQPHDQFRQRSSSTTSEHGRMPYEVPRRLSAADGYPPPAPPVGYTQPSPAGNLNFNQAPASQYPPPPHYGGAHIPPQSPSAPSYSTNPSPQQTPQSHYGPPSRPPSQHHFKMEPQHTSVPPSPQQSIKAEPCSLTSRSRPSLSLDPKQLPSLPSISNLISQPPASVSSPSLRRAETPLSLAPLKTSAFDQDAPLLLADEHPEQEARPQGPNHNGKRPLEDQAVHAESLRNGARPSIEPGANRFHFIDADRQPRWLAGNTFRA